MAAGMTARMAAGPRTGRRRSRRSGFADQRRLIGGLVVLGGSGGRPGRTAPGRGRATGEVGQAGDEGGVVVHRAGALQADADLAGDGLGLDVDVVEDLEVVGHEADRADDQLA